MSRADNINIAPLWEIVSGTMWTTALVYKRTILYQSEKAVKVETTEAVVITMTAVTAETGLTVVTTVTTVIGETVERAHPDSNGHPAVQ